MDARLQKFLQKFQHLKIQLEEITSATNNFNDQKNRIGGGGFGKVYKGEVTHSKGRSMAAIKRLDPSHGQGIPEFLKEVTMLSDYKHENLISLLGFCCQGREMILVYEHASRGSLDHHLNSANLTWTQRMKICLAAAKGLSYLHDPRETHRRLIHCDIKSSNILLDEQWNAIISDFGLSITGSANEQQSTIITLAAGTPGYLDPQYEMTHTLTKESDVYSFGVVLFEVLCGRLCCTYSNGHVQHNLLPTWIKSYEEENLNDIIFKGPTIEPLDKSSLDIFSDVAYRCLNKSREDRPKMTEVVTQLETALETQEFSEWKPLYDYEEMTKTAEPPFCYKSKFELWKLLSKGVFLNSGKTCFSINKNGDYSEMISFAECVESGPSKYASKYNSRFDTGTYPYTHAGGSVKTHVITQLLLPRITYTVNLVFKFVPAKKMRRCHPIFLKYKLQGEAKTSISYLACERDDGWWMCELYQFTSEQKLVDLEILFCGFKYDDGYIEAEGIEFRPMEKVEQKYENQPVSDLDANWEGKLPTDYENIMQWSKDILQWTTKREAYSSICKGFLINDGQEWFSLDKNGKKSYMLSARAAGISGMQKCWLALPETRFGEAVHMDRNKTLAINSKIQSQLVSSQTTYASYLVYKLPEVQSRFDPPMKVKSQEYLNSEYWYIYLVSPQTPVITTKADQNMHNSVSRPKIKGLPHQRNDGWMEVQIWEFQTATTTETFNMHIELTTCGRKFSGLIIEGIEFRPI